VEKKNCPWCLSLHVAGVCEAAVILNHALRLRRHGERGILEAALFTGGAALAVLAAGQIWGPKPDTHAFTGESSADAARITTPGGGQALTFYHNSQPLTFDTAALPILGPVDAKVTFVEFFDYTCGSCRNLHEDLNALKRKWPGALSVVVLPVPLHRGCNSGIPREAEFEDHQSACELARLGLAMWRASPAQFPAFHQLLLTLPAPVSARQVAAAQRKAEELAGASAFAKALADPWVQERLNENIRLYSLLIREKSGAPPNLKMPKLFLHGGLMMSGILRSTDEFIREMEQRFDFAGSGAPR
jgi:Thioredoxin